MKIRVERVAVVLVCVLFIGLMVYVCWDLTIRAKTMIYECTDWDYKADYEFER